MSDYSSSNIGLITVAPYNAPNNLASYIRKRLDQSKTGVKAITDLVAQFKKECDERTGCSDNTLVQSTDATQQTINAVVAYLHAFKATHQKFCGNRSGVCPELSNTPDFYSTMLHFLLNEPVNVKIGDVDVAVNFDGSGELDYNTLTPALTLHVATKNSGSWRFTDVGTYNHNESWSFSANADSHVFSEENSDSRCVGNCEECQKKTAPYVYRRSKSQYIIAGTAAVNDEQNQHGCGQTVTPNGFIMMASFYYAVEQIQEITGIEFSTLFIDTCYAQLGTHNIMNQIFREEEYAYLKDPAGTEWKIKPTDFVVFIGDASSGISLVLQTYLKLYNIPQISYRSTSTWLSDSLRYPMFLRNVPSDEEQARLMIEIVQKNGWNKIGLIHSDSVYGQTGGNLVKKYANESRICISFYDVVSSTDQSISELVQNIRSWARRGDLPRPIVIFAEEGLIKDVLKKIKLIDVEWRVRGNILIGSETWNRLQDVIEDSEEFAYGALTFSFSDSIYNWTVEGTNYFKNYLVAQTPQNNRDNPLFLRFWQQYFNCYLVQNSLSTSDTPCKNNLNFGNFVDKPLDFEDVVGKHVVMAGLSVAYSIREATYGEQICTASEIEVDCSKLFDSKDRKDFFRILKKTNIPQEADSNKKTYAPYLSSGDGKANYKVYNVIKKEGGLASYSLSYVISDGKIMQVKAPEYYIDGGKPDPEVFSECIDSCDCIPGTGVNDPNSLNQTATMNSLEQEWKAPGWLLPLLVMIFLLLCVLVAAAALYIVYLRKNPTLDKEKYNQPDSVSHRGR